MIYSGMVTVEIEMFVEDIEAPDPIEAQRLLRKTAEDEVARNDMLTVRTSSVAQLHHHV